MFSNNIIILCEESQLLSVLKYFTFSVLLCKISALSSKAKLCVKNKAAFPHSTKLDSTEKFYLQLFTQYRVKNNLYANFKRQHYTRITPKHPHITWKEKLTREQDTLTRIHWALCLQIASHNPSFYLSCLFIASWSIGSWTANRKHLNVLRSFLWG